MAVAQTLVAKVGVGGKVEFVLPEGKEGDFVSLTVEPVVGRHPERIGFAPGYVISVGPDFDKPWVPDDVA